MPLHTRGRQSHQPYRAADVDDHADRMRRGRQQRAVEAKRRNDLKAAEEGWDSSFADDFMAAEGKTVRLDGSRVEGAIGHHGGPGRPPQWHESAQNQDALEELQVVFPALGLSYVCDACYGLARQGGWGSSFFDKSGHKEEAERARLAAVRDAVYGSQTLLANRSYVSNAFDAPQYRPDRVKGGAINYQDRMKKVEKAYEETVQVRYGI